MARFLSERMDKILTSLAVPVAYYPASNYIKAPHLIEKGDETKTD